MTSLRKNVIGREIKVAKEVELYERFVQYDDLLDLFERIE